MERSWLVRPDAVIDTEEFGPIAFVSEEGDYKAWMDARSVVARCGGGVTVWSQRVPTGVPGEMVTTALIFTWRDRTDAKPQPERQTDAVPGTQHWRVTTEPAVEETPAQITGEAPDGAVVVPGDDNPDGFDVAAAEEAEDEAAITADVR